MLHEAIRSSPRFAHLIVVGNEKGGTGKSTVAMHIAVALIKTGQRVATIDLDSRQASLTHYIANRHTWAEQASLALEIPAHFCINRAEGIKVDENENIEFTDFKNAICEVEHTHDFVVIDTPGTDSYLMRFAHSMADTLVTPINDSYVDFDVLGHVDPLTLVVTGESHYSKMVRKAQNERRIVDGGLIDWIVMCNRFSLVGAPSSERLNASLNALGSGLGFRVVAGFSERVVYRDLYPRGLTALDTFDEATLDMCLSQSQEEAREEVMRMLAALKLPIDERGHRRAAVRQEWLATHDMPLDVAEILV